MQKEIIKFLKELLLSSDKNEEKNERKISILIDKYFRIFNNNIINSNNSNFVIKIKTVAINSCNDIVDIIQNNSINIKDIKIREEISNLNFISSKDNSIVSNMIILDRIKKKIRQNYIKRNIKKSFIIFLIIIMLFFLVKN